MKRKAQKQKIPVYVLYGEVRLNPAGSLLHIETIEARSARHHWKIEPHRHHALHQLIVVTKGGGVVLADGQRSQYRPAAVVMMPAGVVHGFEFEPGTRGHVVSVSVDLLNGFAQREPGVAALFASHRIVELRRGDPHASDLARSVSMLAREFNRLAAGSELALHGWVAVLLGNLLKLSSASPNLADPVGGQRQRMMARFTELVESRFREHHAVAAFARALHVSESHLRGVCLASTGQSPIQLIHARILLEAKRQLHYTGNPVSEIAFALGFEDPAYFTRFFTRLAGDSPRAFRRKGPERAAARL